MSGIYEDGYGSKKNARKGQNVLLKNQRTYLLKEIVNEMCTL